MSLRKHLVVFSLIAASLGLALTPSLQAAFVPSGASADADGLVVQTATTSKAKAKTAKVKPRKMCGTNMYWSAKEKKCLDARTKKSSGS